MSYWSFNADVAPDAGNPHTVWPDGCVSLSVPLVGGGRVGPLLCTGPRAVAFQPPITAKSALLGVRFWPDAAGSLFGVPAQSLRDWLGPAPAELSDWASGMQGALADDSGVSVAESAAAVSNGGALRGQLARLDAWLTTRLRSAPAPDPTIRSAIQRIAALRGEARVGEVAAELGVGLRQLQRRFPAATGLTLREWARVRRLRSALAERLARAGGTWSRIAAETGFVDHAHLTREFVQLTGLPPSRAERLLRSIVHQDVRP